ncbi:MAG: hypothetical protein ACP6IS_03115 [Candidatus Asgardarchaeia archaeon]
MRSLIRSLPTVACPYCGAKVSGHKIDYSKLKELYERKFSPIPIQVACPNNHLFIVYAYPDKGKVKVSDISETLPTKR